MSVTIADILGANEEPEEKKEYFDVDNTKTDLLSKFSTIAQKAKEVYDEKSNGQDIGIGMIPLVSRPEGDVQEDWLFLIEIEAGEPVGMIVFPVERLSTIFGILAEVMNDYIKPEGDDS